MNANEHEFKITKGGGLAEEEVISRKAAKPQRSKPQRTEEFFLEERTRKGVRQISEMLRILISGAGLVETKG
jgi:hypothetical protein